MKSFKKILCSVLSLLMLSSLVACVSSNGFMGDNTTSDPISNVTLAKTPTISQNSESEFDDGVGKEIPPANGTESIPDMTVTTTVDQTLILASGTVEFPIIINQYPYSHGGLGVEVTEELRRKIEQRLADYLSLANVDYREFVLNDLAIDDGIYYIEGIPGLSLISAKPTSIGMGLDCSEDITSLNDLKGNLYYIAALAYLGLTAPVIQEYPACDSSGILTSVEYVIYEAGDNSLETILNRSFSCVTVRFTYNDETTHIYLSITDIPVDKLASERSILDFDEALAYAGLTSSDEIMCEIIYDSEAQYGFYIPVYTFYTREKNSATAYEVVRVPAVN